MAREKAELERLRKEMVARELDSLHSWDLAEGSVDMPLGFVPDNGVVWDLSTVNGNEVFDPSWVLQPSGDSGRVVVGSSTNS